MGKKRNPSERSRFRIAQIFLMATVCAVTPAQALAAASNAPEVPSATEQGGDGSPAFRGSHLDFRLPPFSVPVIRDGRAVGQISLLITVEAADAAKKARLIALRRRLYSAFLRDLYAVASLEDGEPALNLTTVKTRLRRVADRVLGPDVVRRVLVRHAYVRRFR